MPTFNDLHNQLGFATSLAPAARNNTGSPHNGTGVDLAGFRSAAVVFDVGTVTDGTHTPKLQHSEDDGVTDPYVDVPAAEQSGTLANLASNVNQEVSYLGTRRFVRAVITTSGATTGAVAAALVVRDRAITTPT